MSSESVSRSNRCQGRRRYLIPSGLIGILFWRGGLINIKVAVYEIISLQLYLNLQRATLVVFRIGWMVFEGVLRTFSLNCQVQFGVLNLRVRYRLMLVLGQNFVRRGYVSQLEQLQTKLRGCIISCITGMADDRLRTSIDQTH